MHSNTRDRVNDHSAHVMPNALGATPPGDSDAVSDDFIAHPVQFPIKYRRRVTFPWRSDDQTEPTGGDIGLSFRSAKYIPAGARIELEIPLRGDTQRFAGTVVMVREDPSGYEIGLWLASPDDASRARIVERICHTECYLRSRQRKQRKSYSNHAGGRLPALAEA